jgi:hypothetical protein
VQKHLLDEPVTTATQANVSNAGTVAAANGANGSNGARASLEDGADPPFDLEAT